MNAIKIEKGNASKVLSGAEFQLFDATTNTAIGGTVTTNANGKFAFVGLKKGSYYILETKAPAGYQLIGEKISFEITGLADAKVKFADKSTAEIADITDVAFSHGTPFVNYVANTPATDLPLTGGMGVGMFAVIGTAFALIGCAYLFKSRKVDAR